MIEGYILSILRRLRLWIWRMIHRVVVLIEHDDPYPLVDDAQGWPDPPETW